MDEVEILRRNLRIKSIVIIILMFISMIVILLFWFILQSEINKTNNEAVMYCEFSNANANLGDKMIPYFERYMDESIETIGEINSTLSRLLELQLVDKRELEFPKFDCPMEDCDGPFAGPVDAVICDIIKELKYG